MNLRSPDGSMVAAVLEREPITVGGATIDPVSREACWEGGKERLQPQTLKVLRALLSRRNEVVTRDELGHLCWDGRIVSDDVINRAILLLRHLAQQAGGFSIETVPRAGYRLIEIVTLNNAQDGRSRATGLLVGGAAALLALVAAAAWLGQSPPTQGRPPTPNVSLAKFIAQSGDPLVRQIAMNAPSALAHMLSESGFVIVRDRGAAAPSQNDYIFSGTVRRDGASIEATVQMVSKRDATIAYAHEFSAPIDQAAALPDRIGATAAAELAWTGAEMILDPRERLSPEVASELMKAVTLTIEKQNGLRSYQLNRHAAEVAPNSAFPQLALAIQTGFVFEEIPQGERREAVALARRAGERAQQLAPEVGDAYLTWCLLHSPVRMIECDARVRHALQIDSSSSFIPGYLSSLYLSAGRVEEALPLATQSLANDPYKPAKLARMIEFDEASGRSDDAERLYREAVRLWPANDRMPTSRAAGLADRGDYRRLADFVAANDLSFIDRPTFAELVRAEGQRDKFGVEHACSASRLSRYMLGLCMVMLADVGSLDRAYAVAAQLYPAWHAPAGSDPDEFWINHPPAGDTALLTGHAARNFRTDPRFPEVAAKLGLTGYWKATHGPDFCDHDREAVCRRLLR